MRPGGIRGLCRHPFALGTAGFHQSGSTSSVDERVSCRALRPFKPMVQRPFPFM
jgi:hypothetical protein